ncbi:MAG: hypothetical protein LBI99_04270 [Propionibacteriaceae bacterium]|nr:hypothetical protein [Propionibacteriaceae bacterium]
MEATLDGADFIGVDFRGLFPSGGLHGRVGQH